MTDILRQLRAPVVTDADREWAFEQKPTNWDWLADERVAGTGLEPLAWEDWVASEAEAFEAYFAEDRKTYAEWSGLWRRKWLPEGNPVKRFPRTVPREPQPYVKAGDPRFDRALSLATPDELVLWRRFGVAQFKPTDPRVPQVMGAGR